MCQCIFSLSVSLPHPSKFPALISLSFQTDGWLTCTDTRTSRPRAVLREPGFSDSNRCISVSRCFSGLAELYKSSYSPASSLKAPRDVQAVCAPCSWCRQYWSQQRSVALQTTGLKEVVTLFNRTFTGAGRTDVAETRRKQSGLVWPASHWQSRIHHQKKKKRMKKIIVKIAVSLAQRLQSERRRQHFKENCHRGLIENDSALI